MAKRGETTLTDSEGQTFVVRFGTNAICEMQKRLNKTFGEILKTLEPANLDLATVRTMVECAVIHPADATAEQVGDLIDDVGVEMIGEAIAKVFRRTGGPPGKPSGADSASSASPSASTPTDLTH